jgi:hypothetical protein
VLRFTSIWGIQMRLYIIGFMVGVIGLVAANQVRADERCGLRSDAVLKVQRWNVEQTGPHTFEIEVHLDSKDPKTITDVTGSVEFFAGNGRILTLPLRFEYPIQFKSHFRLRFERKELPAPITVRAPDVEAFACVDTVIYADGSGVIIN